MAIWRSEVDASEEATERAFQLYRERGDRRGAARMATKLAYQAANFRGEGAVASGWLQRARHLLEGLDPSAELANLFRKLSVSSRAAAVGEAARRGLSDCSEWLARARSCCRVA